MFILYAALQGYRASMTRRLLLSAALVAGCEDQRMDVDPVETRLQMREAAIALESLGGNAERIFRETGAFPIGAVGPTPAERCCGGRCAAWKEWDHPLWQALHIKFFTTQAFRYSYASRDGKTAVATAVGDLDCDGWPLVFTLKLRVNASGEVETKLATPPWQDD